MAQAKKESDDLDKAPCVLKEMPHDLKRHTINLMAAGEEGAVQEYTNLLINLFKKSETDDSWDKKSELFDKFSKFIKDVYGKKLKQEHSGQVDFLTAEDFENIYDKYYGEKDE